MDESMDRQITIAELERFADGLLERFGEVVAEIRQLKEEEEAYQALVEAGLVSDDVGPGHLPVLEVV
jgi:hypothetical protein